MSPLDSVTFHTLDSDQTARSAITLASNVLRCDGMPLIWYRLFVAELHALYFSAITGHTFSMGNRSELFGHGNTFAPLTAGLLLLAGFSIGLLALWQCFRPAFSKLLTPGDNDLQTDIGR